MKFSLPIYCAEKIGILTATTKLNTTLTALIISLIFKKSRVKLCWSSNCCKVCHQSLRFATCDWY